MEIHDAARHDDLERHKRSAAKQPPGAPADKPAKPSKKRKVEANPQKQLLRALAAEDLAGLADALAAGADPNPAKGPVPLEEAARQGFLAGVRHLLAAGAVVNPARAECMPLLAAVEGGRLEVLTELLAAGADWRHEHQGVSAVLTAVAGHLWPLVDVLVAAGVEDPLLTPFLAVRDLPTKAAAPAVRELVGRLERRVGTAAIAAPAWPGIAIFALPAASEGAGGNLLDQLTRAMDANESSERELQGILDEFAPLAEQVGGRLLLLDTGHDGRALALVPTTDGDTIIAAIGVDGPSYDLATYEVIELLRDLDAEAPFTLDAIGANMVGGRFRSPLKNPKSTAQRLIDMCPDLLERGFGTLNALAKELSRTRRFELWWD